MIKYTAPTSGKLAAALCAAGWRWLVAPTAHAKNRWQRTSARHAIDNGAWTAHVSGEPFDERAFMSLYDGYADTADWCVIPDIVGGGYASLDCSLAWRPRLEGACPLLLAVQDGMDPVEVNRQAGLGPRLGVFLGGSTGWKLRTMHRWADLCHQTGAYFHVARVNTRRRLAMCRRLRADSFDGSGVARFSIHRERVDGWLWDLDHDPQLSLFEAKP